MVDLQCFLLLLYISVKEEEVDAVLPTTELLHILFSSDS